MGKPPPPPPPPLPPPLQMVFFRGEFGGGGNLGVVGVVEKVLGLFDWLTNISDQTSHTSNRQIVVLSWVLFPPPPPYTTKKRKKKSWAFWVHAISSPWLVVLIIIFFLNFCLSSFLGLGSLCKSMNCGGGGGRRLLLYMSIRFNLGLE